MTKISIVCKGYLDIDFDLKKAEEYLISTGWIEAEKYGPFGRIFTRTGKPLETYKEPRMLLVTTDTIADFQARMSEFINDLAEYENRPPWEVAKEFGKDTTP